MMRRRLVLVFVAVAAAALGTGQLAVRAAAVPAAGSWGKAIEVPGLGALNKGGNAWVVEVSCAAGSCAAGGYYTNSHRHEQGFVASERKGLWGKAIEVPGLGALDKGGDAEVDSVSCAAAGNCAAGGFYTDGQRREQGFAAVERKGVWGKAIEVPGLGALNKGGNAGVSEVSCAAAGSCAAGGDYTDGHRHQQGFVVSMKNNVWGKAIEVPGLGALNKGGNAEIGTGSVSCAAPGSCAAGGDYTNGQGNSLGFVADERNGVWGKAIEVPGLGALDKGGAGDVFAVSCGAAGSCVAGGDYTTDPDYEGDGFVVDERHGRWGQAMNLPGLKALNEGAGAEVDTVSCASAGNCVAAGTYAYPYTAGFMAVEKNGVWDKATDAGLSGRIAGVNSVSCASPGNCAAGGFYSDDSGAVVQGYVAVEQHGRWGKPVKVPGLGALNQGGGAGVDSVSCPRAGSCAAGGSYTDSRQKSQGFVVTQTG